MMTIIGPAVTLFLLLCAAIRVYPLGQLAASYRVLIVVAILYLLFKLFSLMFKEPELASYEFSEVELKQASFYIKLCDVCMLIFVLIGLVIIVVNSYNSLGL